MCREVTYEVQVAGFLGQRRERFRLGFRVKFYSLENKYTDTQRSHTHIHTLPSLGDGEGETVEGTGTGTGAGRRGTDTAGNPRAISISLVGDSWFSV